MKHEKLDKRYEMLVDDARATLKDLVSQNLGKELDIEMEFCLSFTQKFTGEDIDFSWEGISDSGELICTRYDGEGDIEVEVDEVHVWALNEMIKMLEIYYKD